MAPLATVPRRDDAEALVLRHRGLARHLAQRYVRAAEQREDLEQVAYVGLVKAAQRFDAGRGTAFTTFAVPTVLGELRRYCRDTRWAAHVPRSIQEHVQALRALEDTFQSRNGRAPTVSEAASELGWSDEDVVEARMAASTLSPQSLNAPIQSADGTVGEAIDSLVQEDTGFENAEQRDLLERALVCLSAPARRALYLRTQEELSLPEIARRMTLSPSQVGRLIDAALRDLRTALDDSGAVTDTAARARMRAAEPARRVSLASVDPELFAGLNEAQLELARRTALAPRLTLDAGDKIDGSGARLLVMSGALVNEPPGGRAELLGPGDVLDDRRPACPWQTLGRVSVAVLDPAVMRALSPWPAVIDALQARAERPDLAIRDLRRVEDRLEALFWSLADRFGRPSLDGVQIPLTLTHGVIAQVVGAHRPTVSAGLRRLAGAGRLRRLPDRTWLLDPAATAGIAA